MKKDFIEFLRENKAYDAFVDNLTISIEDHVNYYFNEDLVSEAFTWDTTDQGENFWSKLSDKWVDLTNPQMIRIRATQYMESSKDNLKWMKNHSDNIQWENEICHGRQREYKKDKYCNCIWLEVTLPDYELHPDTDSGWIKRNTCK